jgi:hypothetical protein
VLIAKSQPILVFGCISYSSIADLCLGADLSQSNGTKSAAVINFISDGCICEHCAEKYAGAQISAASCMACVLDDRP